MTRLAAVNPLEVGFTHGIGEIAAEIVLQTAGAAAAAAAALARKNTPDLARNVYAPLALVRTRPSR